MDSFPPPNPSEFDISRPTPDTAAGPSRRRTGAIVLITSGLLIGGVAVGSQFVSANTPSLAVDGAPSTEPADEPTSEEPEDETDDETGDNDTGDDEAGDDGAVLIDIFGDGEWGDLEEFLPEGIADGIAAFEQYDECISEQLGQDGGIFFGEDDFLDGYHGSVVVDIPTGDDIDWSSYDFGEGDGSITVTKTGDDIAVSVEGDVSEFDEAAHEAEFEEIEAQWKAAADACADLLPEGVGEIFGEFGEFGDFDFEGKFGEFDLGEFDLGEFDLGEFDLGEFDLGDLEGKFGESDFEGELERILELLD